MFNRLRKKLALAYALLAGVVLMGVAVLCLGMAERELKRASQSAFESGVNAIVYKLQSDNMLTQSWLSQTEAGEKQVIYIEDGNTPLAFQGGWQPSTPREKLIERALKSPEALALMLPLGSLGPASAYYSLMGDDSERYLACATLVPASGKPPIRVIVLRDMTLEDGRLRRQRHMAGLLSLGGLMALAVIGWFYSGRAIMPAQESQKRQAEFTAMASHELKAPLAVITASVDALKTCPPGGERDSLMSNLSGESLRMARLVDDLLLLSRSDAGQWRMKRENVDADTLLIECRERFSPMAREKGISLALSLPESPLPPVAGDGERLYQALCILVDNAVGYTPPGGHVNISAQARGKSLRLIVEDDGPGIPDAQKSLVFERFYRADEAHHDRDHAGLGLSIAREIARLHGGRLELADVKPHGARFTLALNI